MIAPLLLLLVAAGSCLAADGGRQFDYNGFTGANLTLHGAAFTLDGLLMLTNGTIQTKGQAVHPSPLPFRQEGTGIVRSFSTTFVFAIYGQYADLSSHGMAFFLSESKEVVSTPMSSQYLGLFNDTNEGNRSNHHIFAVELDTNRNTEFRDINDNHVGVDVDSMKSLDSANAGYYDDSNGFFEELSLISGKAMQVWVDYDGGAKEVTVTMAPLGLAMPEKPLLRTIVDLSGVLQSTAYVGFSSATGVPATPHFVLGWSFALERPAPALDISTLPALPPLPWPEPQSPSKSKSKSRALEIVLATSATLVSAIGIGIYIFVKRRSLKYSEVHEDWEVPFC